MRLSLRRAAPPLALLVVCLFFSNVSSSPAPAPPPPPHAALGAFVRGPDHLTAGTPAALRVATHWATSESVSGPWAGVEVDVALAGAGRRQALYHGRSDGAGVADARFTVPAWPDGRYTFEITARAGGRTDTHSHPVELQPGARILVESDKPLYQPAQTIHLRAIALRPQDGRPIAKRPIWFTVNDPRGNVVFREQRALSEFGVAAADFALADEITLGNYRARAALDGGDESAAAGTLDLPVSRYALPKLKVAAETDRGWYSPGDTVKLTVDGKYFFGKPVAGGTVTVRATFAGTGTSAPAASLHAKLDGEGHAKLELAIPRDPGPDTLKLHVEVVDTADQRAAADREATIAAQPVRAEVTPEGRALVGGVDNRVWVTATLPDGAPLADAEVDLRVDNERAQNGRTDGAGIAEFLLQPVRGSRSPCPGGQTQLTASVHHAGVLQEFSRCAPLVAAGGILLRTDRAIYPSGAPMRVQIFGLGPDGTAYVDVVKDGQTVDTAALQMHEGRGEITLAADERRFGTLALLAYRLGPDGARVRDSRLVYVDRPSALKVDVHQEGTAPDGSFRPGEPGRVRLHVVDAHSGAPARASVGVVMVDQSLLALRAIKPGVARVYFTLADEATRPQLAMKARPGGYTVEKLVDEGTLDALKQEAARVLLAGAAPPWTAGWEIDPWELRSEAASAQLQKLGETAGRWVETHPAGERAGKHWRFRHDLLPAMIESGALSAQAARDPWGRRVPSAKVLEQAGLGDFSDWAQREVDARLSEIYRALIADGTAKLGRDASANAKSAVVITQADLDRVAAAGRIKKGRLIDPWGAPFRIDERKKFVRVAGLRSRFVVASSGPDGVASSPDDLFALDPWYGARVSLRDVQVRGALFGEAFGQGGLGMIGHGYGSGGGGSVYGASAGSIRLGKISTVGHGAGSGGEERVRSDFPETMLWRPELLTDERGDAIVDMRLADSITTWRFAAEAIAADGRLGQATADVRVFQDFFVDLDLPPAITQHDELAVPVAVYNYLPGAQRVTLTLDDGDWFTPLGERTQSIDLAASQVGVRYFRIRATGVGRRKLTVHAHGTSAADAIERSLEVAPDGSERAVSFQDSLGKDASRADLKFKIPDNAIADASVATLKIYPAMSTHVIEGLDSMLRMPGGCFEQTSSTTYPNALILDYLRRSKKSTAAVEKKAQDYLSQGYQRLLSFEVPGGGFSWFGRAPANKILTAYGVEEFHDMARVHPVDARVITRTQEWLVAQQKPDGSWAPDTYFINEGATNHFNSDVTRITAYIAVALKHTGGDAQSVARAQAYVRKQVDHVSDPYTLALVTELLAAGSGERELLDAVLARLWEGHVDSPDGKNVTFSPKEKTPTYGDGKSGTVETTALAAYAMLQTPGGQLARVGRAVNYLLSSKDTFGNWYSTQATILSLKALLAYSERASGSGRGTVTVAVDGREVASLPVDSASELLQSVELGTATAPGAHAVEVRYAGAGQIAYQMVGRWFEPRGPRAPAKPDDELETATKLDRDRLKPGETLTERVMASSTRSLDMPIVTAGLPPGFDVDGEELDKLVRDHVVEKVQRSAQGVIFYLTALTPEHPLDLRLHLRAKFPERVQIPAPTAYEYYRPERRTVGAPLTVTVDG